MFMAEHRSSVKKGVKMMGWCQGLGPFLSEGVWEPIVKWRTYVHHIHTFLHTGSGPYTTLYSTHTLSHGLISSTTLYSLQFYSSSTVYNLYNTPLDIFPTLHKYVTCFTIGC